MTLNWELVENLTDPGTKLGALALALVVIVLAWVACVITTRLIQRPHRFLDKFDWMPDETVTRYILRFKNVVIFIVAGLFYASLVPGLRALVGTLMAGAGITALVVGFAAKSTLANLISGLSLAVYKPFRIGDIVTIEDEYGTVEDITLRHTIVRTWEYKRLIIPNEKIDSMTLINYSIVDPRILCRVEMGVSYDTDIDLARRLILEEAARCPHRDPEGEEEPWVRVISHGDFAIGLRVYVWVKNVDEAWLARFWLLENVKKRFDLEGVEIPFPYRTLVYKKDLPPAPREEQAPPEPAGPFPDGPAE
ncbi:MAG: mechanosensitive ion channel family protein [Deltaproteobacteria bacterium]|nr:mechanosensitive ion channel family protein [Deltaproteobacteria bacterium]